MIVADLDIYVENRALHLRHDFYAITTLSRSLDKIGITSRILDTFDPADVGGCAIVHADLTELPERLRDVHRYYPVCINGRATTISRLRYSKAIIERSDPHDGPVIVKTVLNSRGIPELRYAEARTWRTRFIGRIGRMLDRRYEAKRCPPYRVFADKSEVPAVIWADRRRIVERFIPGSLELPVVKYRINFFQDITLNKRMAFESLISKPDTMVNLEIVDDVPKEVDEVRAALVLDFGAIDYFEKDGEVFVVDANKTPMMPQAWLQEYPLFRPFADAVVDRLAQLIRSA